MCPHMLTALWVLWCANPLSFPCVLAVPSGWRWLMMAMVKQIIWMAPSTQDVNQISFANDSQTLIWQPWPEPYCILHRGTKETSISPKTVLFDHSFQKLMFNSSKISFWKIGPLCVGTIITSHACVVCGHVWEALCAYMDLNMTQGDVTMLNGEKIASLGYPISAQHGWQT